MNKTYLILGSNLGDKIQSLQQAIKMIGSEIGDITAVSDVYVTAAWGNSAQPDFVNQVVVVDTSLYPAELLKKILAIEKKLGRIRDEQKWKERIVDIDILFYNNAIIKNPDLMIPHPYIKERKFVLVPLAEIAPDFIHPVYNKSIHTLLKECKDPLEVDALK